MLRSSPLRNKVQSINQSINQPLSLFLSLFVCLSLPRLSLIVAHLKDQRVLTRGGDGTAAGLVGTVVVVVEEVGLQKQLLSRQRRVLATHIVH